MIPAPGQTLADIATRLATHLLPELGSEYGQADAGLLATLLLTISQDYERAVDNRMTDVEEMRDLFESATGAPNLNALLEYTQSQPQSLHLRDVNAHHAQGFEYLIELHTWAEHHSADLDTEIWAFLRRHNERNKFDIPGP